MPENRIALSPHVQRLVDEKYAVSIEGEYIVVDNVPYVSAAGVISRAAIISAYYEKDGVAQFGDHTVLFTGSVPCTPAGESLAHVLVADTNPVAVAGRQALCRFSYKSERADTLDNIYNKLTHYIRKLQSYVSVIDPTVSAAGDGSISVRQAPSVFFYPNTAVARAGLDVYEGKLKLAKVAIVGLGGTGSYILDAIAKTPVKEIHLYDEDIVEPATAYRMPGALTIDEAHQQVRKTDYLRNVYCRMRTGIESHPIRIDQGNVHELDDINFVFIAVDHGPSRGLIARHLAEKGIPFVDVGMGVDRVPEATKLIARIRVTAIDCESKSLVDRLPVSDDQEDAVYNNIQVAELNALNAMLAVIVYKQKIGFYSEEIAVNALHYVLTWQRLLHNHSEPA
ncbi:MAG: ThiF family adenylyltransferase [Nitrospiraceae bacterium]|nr:ThiF family adenylyltransferase [Nitrospiraceae bacterium]